MIKPLLLDFDIDKIFFTSDLHYNHKNISKDSVWDRVDDNNIRPFALKEMNESIIKTINETVPWDGVLIHLGDWSFGGEEYVSKLRNHIYCENIIGCYGNHDHNILKHQELKDLFLTINHILYLNIKGQIIMCCHYPIGSWYQMHKGTWMLHGHCHGSYPDNPNIKILDVGWDTNLYNHKKYTPYSFKELNTIMSIKKNISVDHHK